MRVRVRVWGGGAALPKEKIISDAINEASIDSYERRGVCVNGRFLKTTDTSCRRAPKLEE